VDKADEAIASKKDKPDIPFMGKGAFSPSRDTYNVAD
jgi:hypothetical protein